MDKQRRNILMGSLLAGVAAGAVVPAMAAESGMFRKTDETPKPEPAATRPKRVLVAGATGEIGRYVVKDLLDRGVAVRGLTRQPDVARVGEPRAEWVAGDMREPASLAAAVAGVDAIVFAAGWRPKDDSSNTPRVVDYGGVVALAEAARERGGVNRFVLISSAGVTRPVPANFAGPVAEVIRWKARGELALKASGVPYTILRPYGLGKAEAGKMGILLLQGDIALKSIVVVARQDLAQVAAGALFEPAAHNVTCELFNADTFKLDAWRTTLGRLQPD